MQTSLPTRMPVMSAFKTGSKRSLEITFVSRVGTKTECLVESTVEQYMRWYNQEDHVQNIYPLLDADMRELFVTGMGPAEWDRLVGGAA
ncbi:hypothetical protein VPHK251G3_0091 [Vibrio phage K251 g3]